MRGSGRRTNGIALSCMEKEALGRWSQHVWGMTTLQTEVVGSKGGAAMIYCGDVSSDAGRGRTVCNIVM